MEWFLFIVMILGWISFCYCAAKDFAPGGVFFAVLIFGALISLIVTADQKEPVQTPTKQEPLSLEVYDQIDNLVGKCNSADNKGLELMTTKTLVQEDEAYIQSIIVDCREFMIRQRLEK